MGILPFRPARGNPIPSPPFTTKVGTEFAGTQIKFKSANVTLDVYSAFTQGIGTYTLENIADAPNTLGVTFVAWYREVNLFRVLVNQTIHNYSITCQYSGCEERYKGLIQLDFPPNGTQVLQIWWNFTNIDVFETYYEFPEHPRWISFRTGYQINGGDCWGGIPIEWEEVRFNFHTNAFFSSSQNVSICFEPNYCFEGSSIQLPLDANGIPYFLYHAENINESVFISICNVPYYEVQDNFAIYALAITTGTAIAIPLCFRKKTRTPIAILSILGVCCFLIFTLPSSIPLPHFNYFQRGMIMLVVYLGGIGIFLYHYFLQPRLRKRLYKREMKRRLARLTPRRCI